MISDFTLLDSFGAVAIALAYILLSSLLSEPTRQQLSSVIVAGAGATYLSSGLGGWEAFCGLRFDGGKFRFLEGYEIQLLNHYKAGNLLEEIRRTGGLIRMVYLDDALISRATLKIEYRYGS